MNIISCSSSNTIKVMNILLLSGIFFVTAAPIVNDNDELPWRPIPKKLLYPMCGHYLYSGKDTNRTEMNSCLGELSENQEEFENLLEEQVKISINWKTEEDKQKFQEIYRQISELFRQENVLVNNIRINLLKNDILSGDNLIRFRSVLNSVIKIERLYYDFALSISSGKYNESEHERLIFLSRELLKDEKLIILSNYREPDLGESRTTPSSFPPTPTGEEPPEPEIDPPRFSTIWYKLLNRYFRGKL